jgi:hypothetical protein
MAIKKLTLTEDHIKLIRAMNPVKFEFDDDSKNAHIGVGYDNFSIWGGSYLYEDIALVLGFFEESLEGTENDYTGRRYSPEREAYMNELYDFFDENLFYIESLVHQFCDKGGLTPGTYKCIDYQLNWEKID